MNKHTQRIPITGMTHEEWIKERKNEVGGSDADSEFMRQGVTGL